MKIAVLGTGAVGGTLGKRWARCGHELVFGSRTPDSEKVRALLAEAGGTATAALPSRAVQTAEVVLLAVPWPGVRQFLAECGNWQGKVLIDCTNPLNAAFTGLELGFTTSAAEEIAKAAPGARVVKAFNTASARTLANPMFGQYPATMFFCGDDPSAKEQVGRLIAELDFEPVDAGPLANARHLEPLAMLYIHLAVHQGWGSNCAFKILRR